MGNISSNYNQPYGPNNNKINQETKGTSDSAETQALSQAASQQQSYIQALQAALSQDFGEKNANTTIELLGQASSSGKIITTPLIKSSLIQAAQLNNQPIPPSQLDSLDQELPTPINNSSSQPPSTNNTTTPTSNNFPTPNIEDYKIMERDAKLATTRLINSLLANKKFDQFISEINEKKLIFNQDLKNLLNNKNKV